MSRSDGSSGAYDCGLIIGRQRRSGAELAMVNQVTLRPDQVLVTIGTPQTMSAVGGAETTRALVETDPNLMLYMAFDAGLIDLDPQAEPTGPNALGARWRDGTSASVADVEAKHGAELRAEMGIRAIGELVDAGAATDIAAPLPYDLGSGGLRRLSGLTYGDIRGSELKDLHGLFDDDPVLGPSLQAQLCVYAGLGALASLDRPLSEIVDDPADFRVIGGSSFWGTDSWAEIGSPADAERPRDKFAARLASSLVSHGTALVSTMLSPSFPLSKTMKQPELLDDLRSPSGSMRVPQTPLNTAGACASGLIALSEIAPQMLFSMPGYRAPKMVLWTAADSPTRPRYEVLEGFGPNALVTTAKLAEMNADRAPADRRDISRSLAPFDIDASGTVIGDAGSAVLVTTLDVALEHFLDITSIIVGWGQSGETGGKAHFAGVGFGGENALIQAFDLAREAHGYGVGDFGYLAAHATGTRTNSKTDLTSVAGSRNAAAERGGRSGPLPSMHVGTPKALGDGHTMGETGLKAVAQALRYVMGEQAVGLPALRQLDPELGPAAEQFSFDVNPVAGDADGGAVCATQGFGGYNGAVALRAANADSLARYGVDAATLSAYLERWPEIRSERQQRERHARLTRGAILELVLQHRWQR